MPGLLADVDPEGLLEYSVVFTDRSLNHMSASFQQVMVDISSTLKQVYNAQAVAVVPGGGTFAMEAVARQFASAQKCLVIRNGWFSYRWSQILEMGQIARDITVLAARPVEEGPEAAFAPAPIEEVVAAIAREKPAVVFAPHVETASGMLLPDDYIRQVAQAVHQVGGLLVLDCIASGTLWVDMQDCGVDVLISAPQKGWSASPCAGLVMLGENARQRLETTTSSSFACDLKKWLQIMAAYENGGHAYHATMPTDGLVKFHASMQEMQQLGFDRLRQQQIELGVKVRALLASQGFKSVAAEGFTAPGVVVCYTRDAQLHSGLKFKQLGLQTAAGVPLQCNEPEDYQTFRIGLFGLDKLANIDRTVATLEQALLKLGE
ncbi:MAG: alanine--glyoxylate aminotransferase family protein [Gammaproteobacteria bacterium]|nr:alanine--glyoxylate aminotransferase family protein [Gammaproteobacteria bacterium]